MDSALRNSEFNHTEDGPAYFVMFKVTGFKYNKENKRYMWEITGDY